MPTTTLSQILESIADATDDSRDEYDDLPPEFRNDVDDLIN